MQSIDNISHGNPKLSIEEKVGKALRHSGMALLLTSLTDVLAFAIGTITVRILVSKR